MSIDAVVLAGRANDGKLKDSSPEAWEALIDIAGKPMLQYVLDALAEASSIGEVVVVGPPALAERVRCERARYVPPGGSMVDNLSRGIEALPGRGTALVCTSDIPLITPRAVDGFVAECGSADADFYYPIVRRENAERVYPGVKRTYARIADGVFTGGNMFVARVAVAERLRKTLEFLVENRKKPFRMAAVLGIPFVLKLLLGKMTIREAEDKVMSMYGIKARAVQTAFAEIGVDVDKPSDLELARAVLSGAVRL